MKRTVEERKSDELISFLDYITVRLEEVNYQLMEVKVFIENDGYAKENAEKLKPFFDDISQLIDKVEHIYDNVPTDY